MPWLVGKIEIIIKRDDIMLGKVKQLAIALLLGAAGLFYIAYCFANNNDTYKQLGIFGDVFSIVKKEYVFEPNDKKMIEGAINGMLLALDPHSSYMNAQEANDMKNLTKGEFAGLGIEVTLDHGLVKVVSPMLGTPAAKAGILSGDLISKIDDNAVAGSPLQNSVDKMRGKVGSVVKLTVIRKGVANPLQFTVTRAIIKIEALRYKIVEDIGYIRLLEFTGHSYDDLLKAINNIKKALPADKLIGYVLDLRLNPGGLLDQAVKVSNAFLDNGEIVSTKGRQQRTMMRFDAQKGDQTDGKPIMVLINGGTASAAEIVAGALQDNKRAKILGTRSFGKGSVQTIVPLPEGGALRLTTALYYTPSGRSIQGHGIDPDIEISEPIPAKYKGLKIAIGESELHGHIKGALENTKGSGSSVYVPENVEEDVQLKAAYTLLRGQKLQPSIIKSSKIEAHK